MKYDMDKLMKEMYQEEIKPDNILNQRTLHKMMMKESGEMRKSWNYKKIIAAAALGCVVLAGGAGVTYAAINHTSLLSLFDEENSNVKDTAKKLLETNVKQDSSSNKEQTKYAEFSVREAICDKNSVNVQAVAKPVSNDYLLVPAEIWSEADHYTIENLRIDGVSDTSETIKEYAERMHKKCIMVDISIEAKADSQSIDYSTEADGTLVYKFSFDNVEKTKKLKYTCNTLVDASEDGNDNSLIKDSFEFALNDKSGDVDKIEYIADSDKVINGTHLVLDNVDVEKSALGMEFIVNYHTVDPKVKEWSKWIESKDSDMLFYLLDGKGNVIDFKESSGIENTQGDGTRVQKDVYSLQTLPDKLTFLVKDCMTKEKIGTVTVTRTKNK